MVELMAGKWEVKKAAVMEMTKVASMDLLLVVWLARRLVGETADS